MPQSQKAEEKKKRGEEKKKKKEFECVHVFVRNQFDRMPYGCKDSLCMHSLSHTHIDRQRDTYTLLRLSYFCKHLVYKKDDLLLNEGMLSKHTSMQL